MKTALCGVWHVHARQYFEEALKYSEVVGVYEENAEWRKEFCEKYGVKEFTSFEELLESEAEGVIVCTATNEHPEIIERLAKAGKHIFTEKVLALTDEDAKKLADVIEENKVNFVISLVHRYAAGPLTVKSVIDSGELGKLNYIRFRNCHSGSVAHWLPPHFFNKDQCGGGAMIDLGAHGMYLTNWIHGMPSTFSSTFTVSCEGEQAAKENHDGVEDNAITVMSYPDGCIAVNETGFVSNGCPMSLEVGGEKGYVRFDDKGVFKNTLATEGKSVEVPMCETETMPVVQFLTGKVQDGCGMKEALALTHMMVEAYKNKV